MIVRDHLGIIIQHDHADPLYADGGDSSRSTGMLALFGSKEDKIALSFHITAKGFVRHPRQEKWKDPKDFSRDQLLCLAAGLHASKKSDEVKKHFYRQYWKGICDNGDLLGPEFYFHVILCGRIYWLYFMWPLGILAQVIHIVYTTQIAPRQEQNQTIAMAKVSGLLWLWAWLHPDWKASLDDYWSKYPFRDQKEIADIIIKGIIRDLD